MNDRRRFLLSLPVYGGFYLFGLKHVFSLNEISIDKRETLDRELESVKYWRAFSKALTKDLEKHIESLPTREKFLIKEIWNGIETAYKQRSLKPLYITYILLLQYITSTKPNCRTIEALLTNDRIYLNKQLKNYLED